MNYDLMLSRTVINTPPSGIRKFFDVAATMKDCISLGVGEPDFITPWNIREAAIDSIKRGHTCYTSNSGIMELRELVCEYYEKQFNVKYDPIHTLITVGASEGIDLALRTLVNPGDDVLIPEPSYVSYSPVVRFAGGNPVAIETTDTNGFKLTAELIRDAITPNTKAIIFPYPNNPTGSIMTHDELAAAVEPLRGTNIAIVSDEIYAELTYDGKHCSVASIDGMKERTIVLNGFSKAFAMTGWRLGYALGPDRILEQMLKVHQLTMLCASTMSQDAGIEAMRIGLHNDFADVVEMRKQYDRRRRYLMQALSENGLSCFEPKGAFYVFPSIESTGLSSDDFCEKLLWSKKVACVPGTAFGHSGEGFIRISYACSINKLAEAMKRIREFIDEL